MHGRGQGTHEVDQNDPLEKYIQESARKERFNSMINGDEFLMSGKEQQNPQKKGTKFMKV